MERAGGPAGDQNTQEAAPPLGGKGEPSSPPRGVGIRPHPAVCVWGGEGQGSRTGDRDLEQTVS